VAVQKKSHRIGLWLGDQLTAYTHGIPVRMSVLWRRENLADAFMGQYYDVLVGASNQPAARSASDVNESA
jgi:hypothetical protein